MSVLCLNNLFIFLFSKLKIKILTYNIHCLGSTNFEVALIYTFTGNAFISVETDQLL
jgi:hypothetical protein